MVWVFFAGRLHSHILVRLLCRLHMGSKSAKVFLFRVRLQSGLVIFLASLMYVIELS